MVQATKVAERGEARQLVRSLFTVVRRAKHLRQEHLTGPVDRASMGVLFYAVSHEPIRVSDLANSLQLDPSTVSRQVKLLCDAGYVESLEDPGDRRARLLHVTDAGRQVVRDHLDQLAEAIGDALGSWSVSDRSALTTLMTRLADDLGPSDGPPDTH